MSYLNRKAEILSYLAKAKNKTATVKELTKQLYVSEATVRRDLDDLQREGQVERCHGGAILVDRTNDEFSIFIRQAKNAKEKMRASEIAIKYIPDFQTVFIDNSSTCLALAERLNFSHKIIVTNGLHLAAEISRQDNVTIISPGGEIKSNAFAVTGSMTLSALHNFRFDLALLSCAAIDASGSYEFSPDSAEIKKAAMSSSKTNILVVDRTKIGTTATFHTADIADYDYILTDADDDALTALKKINPNIKNK